MNLYFAWVFGIKNEILAPIIIIIIHCNKGYRFYHPLSLGGNSKILNFHGEFAQLSWYIRIHQCAVYSAHTNVVDLDPHPDDDQIKTASRSGSNIIYNPDPHTYPHQRDPDPQHW